jgi:hypothetical protein
MCVANDEFMSAVTLAILIEVFRGVPQSFQADARILLEATQKQFSFLFYTIY